MYNAPVFGHCSHIDAAPGFFVDCFRGGKHRLLAVSVRPIYLGSLFRRLELEVLCLIFLWMPLAGFRCQAAFSDYGDVVRILSADLYI